MYPIGEWSCHVQLNWEIKVPTNGDRPHRDGTFIQNTYSKLDSQDQYSKHTFRNVQQWVNTSTYNLTSILFGCYCCFIQNPCNLRYMRTCLHPIQNVKNTNIFLFICSVFLTSSEMMYLRCESSFFFSFSSLCDKCSHKFVVSRSILCIQNIKRKVQRNSMWKWAI